MKKRIEGNKIPEIEVATREAMKILANVSRTYTQYYKQKCEDIK
jgi:hypothetical protein